MEVANTTYYNKFSLKLLEDALYELSASKLDYGDRYFIIKTGERGAIQFHKAVLQTDLDGPNLLLMEMLLRLLKRLKVLYITML